MHTIYVEHTFFNWRKVIIYSKAVPIQRVRSVNNPAPFTIYVSSSQPCSSFHVSFVWHTLSGLGAEMVLLLGHTKICVSIIRESVKNNRNE